MNNIVSNLRSPRSGAPVANQFVINHDGRITFMSYTTRIAYYENDTLYLDNNALNYSRTTSKYLYVFTNMSRNELLHGLASGAIKKFN